MPLIEDSGTGFNPGAIKGYFPANSLYKHFIIIFKQRNSYIIV